MNREKTVQNIEKPSKISKNRKSVETPIKTIKFIEKMAKISKNR